MGPGPLRDTVRAVVDANAGPIRATTLGAKLLQLCLPGVPDTYQGCEVVDLSLVDPDNRRPVDFEARARRLDRLAHGPATDLDDEKMLVTTRALHLRRADPEAFGMGATYRPLQTTSEHALGFLRSDRVAAVVTRAPARLAAAGGWGDTALDLPEGRWHDVLTGLDTDGRLADLLAVHPVALLVRKD